MSIQDESFPTIDDLEFSNNSGTNFVFPHHKAHRYGIIEDQQTNEENEVFAKENTSLSSPQQNDNESTQSSNDFRLPSETSSKTNASEPIDLQVASDKKKSSGFIRHNPNKAVSYQDILHSEYTKRRYKHVESKVGQYIANIKAQDEKRRSSSKFQRHRSMPETLQERETTAIKLDDSKKHGLLRRSTNDLDRLQSDPDSDNYKNLSSTSSLSTRDLDSENGIFLDKQTYEQLLSDKERKDYLQTKLDERNAAYWRLKKNLDTIRIEYSICKDKLKQQTQMHRLTGSYGSINAVSTLQSLVHPQDTKEKYTQTSPNPTENKPDNDSFSTSLTPDSNHNSIDYAALALLAAAAQKVLKSVATIQPLSLNLSNLVDQDLNSNNINTTTMGFLSQRSNSLATGQKSAPFLPAHIPKISSTASSEPSSSDSAIDIEVTESSTGQHESRREEFIFYEQRSQSYAVVETHNASPNDGNNTDPNSECSTSKCRKQHYLRSRMMRLFGTCIKCKDGNN